MRNIGIARVRVEQRRERSIVTQQFGKAPLQVHRPLYFGARTYPTLYLRSPSAGLLDGDAHILTVEVAENAGLELRTQAACLVYPGKSKQEIQINLAPQAFLHYVPHPLILAKAAHLKQTISISMDSTSALIFADRWRSGRIAMNETWQFESFENALEIRVNDRLFYREHWTLSPRETTVTDATMCGDHNSFDTYYGFGSSATCAYWDDRSFEEAVRQHLDDENAKVWRMQRQNGRIVRVLGKT